MQKLCLVPTVGHKMAINQAQQHCASISRWPQQDLPARQLCCQAAGCGGHKRQCKTVLPEVGVVLYGYNTTVSLWSLHENHFSAERSGSEDYPSSATVAEHSRSASSVTVQSVETHTRNLSPTSDYESMDLREAAWLYSQGKSESSEHLTETELPGQL